MMMMMAMMAMMLLLLLLLLPPTCGLPAGGTRWSRMNGYGRERIQYFVHSIAALLLAKTQKQSLDKIISLRAGQQPKRYIPIDRLCIQSQANQRIHLL